MRLYCGVVVSGLRSAGARSGHQRLPQAPNETHVGTAGFKTPAVADSGGPGVDATTVHACLDRIRCDRICSVAPDHWCLDRVDAPAILLSFLPRIYFGRVREKRLSEVQRAWPDGIRDLVASISSGMSLQRAVEQLAISGPEPLQFAFERFAFLARTLGAIPALEVVKEELADPTSDRVIEVLILAQERGGAIVPDILRDLAAATTQDMWTLEEIQTQQLEQKINARAVFVLPWFVLIAITLRDGPFRDFYRSGAGIVIVALGAILSGFGIWLVTRLSDEPTEARVFGGAASQDPA